MGTLTVFLLKSILVSGLLTIWYFAALRGRRLHQYNRFFLLSALFASLTVPFLHFRLFSVHRIATSGLSPVSLFAPSENMGTDLAAATQPSHVQFQWPVIIAFIAATVSMALLVILLTRILKIWRMSRQYPVTRLEGVNMVMTDLQQSPFTFLKYVFWNKTISTDEETGRLILKHELAHIHQGHTYDKLVCQVLTCIFWFNPFYWIILKELDVVHEFIADEQAINNGDTEAFALMLLHPYSNGRYMVPQHYFFSSGVKRRLAMMGNAAKPSYAMLRRFAAVPLLAGVILLFSFTVYTSPVGNIKPSKKKIVVVLDAGHGGKDAGAQYGGYTEKELCLKCAKRIKELAPAYNIEIRLTRDNDAYIPLNQRVSVQGKTAPDLFVSLHVGDEPGTDKAKGDVDIYVGGGNANSGKSGNYASAVFLAMEQDGVIPGGAKGCKHDHTQACSACSSKASQMPTRKESIYVLKNAPAPAMVVVLGNIKNKEGMQQFDNNDRMDILCNAILRGIVDGANEKKTTGNGCGPGSKDPNSVGTELAWFSIPRMISPN